MHTEAQEPRALGDTMPRRHPQHPDSREPLALRRGSLLPPWRVPERGFVAAPGRHPPTFFCMLSVPGERGGAA